LKALNIFVRPELKLRTFNSARLNAGLESRIYPALFIAGGFIPLTSGLFQVFQYGNIFRSPVCNSVELSNPDDLLYK
jgi:hypothetical protein